MTKNVTRDDWINQKVLLWSSDHLEVLAEGYILSAYPHEAIKNEELGSDHVGIISPKLLQTLQCIKWTLFPMKLVKWKILMVIS